MDDEHAAMSEATDHPAQQSGQTHLPAIPELSQLMIILLKGVIYRQDDERLWASLLRLQTQVRAQAAVLLLELVLDEAEGYAFLKSRPDPDEGDPAPRPPRLMARRPLSYPVSLMLALLRKRMAEADAAGGDTRLVLAREDMIELMRVFLPESSQETRIFDHIDATVNKIIELGFVRKLKPAAGTGPQAPRFEVQRILKAFVDAQWLADFDARLAAYRSGLSNPEEEEDSGA